MEEFKIDKGLPIPKTYSRKLKYPLRQMEIGDSIFISGGVHNQIGSAITRARPLKFTTRMVVENGVSGIRVWRTA